MRKIFTFLILFSIFNIPAQSVDAKYKISSIMNKMQSMPPYSCDVTIKIDVKFIKIKDRIGKMFYSSPTQIDYKINGFAFLPKKEMMATSNDLFKSEFIALDLGKQESDNIICDVIKVIPLDIESEIVTGQFWITNNALIHKMTIITKDQGSYSATFEYKNVKFDLPIKIVMSFDVKDQKIPALLSGDLEGYTEELDKEEGDVSKGKITIKYSNHIFE
jgi:hypothetical protein